MLPIAIYLRISNDPLNLAAGVGRQRTDCTRIATTRWPDHPVREYVDNDISASKYTKRTRPAFQQLREDIRTGQVHAMVGWNFDRTFRKPRELEDFLDLCDQVRFTRAVTAQGDVDLTTDDGKLHARILTAVAAKASDDTSRRVKRALQDRDEKGLHRGGKIAYGYRRVDGQPQLDAAAARVVRSMAQLVSSGVPLRQVARRQTKPAPTSATGVKRLLLSPTIVGRTSLGVRGKWDPIISDAEQADLRALLTAPARWMSGPRPAGGRSWWLSGLVRCGKCGAKLQITGDKGVGGANVMNYQCRDCNSVSIRADMLMWHVEHAMFGTKDEPGFVVLMERVAAGRTGGLDDTKGETVEVDALAESRLAELATLYATGVIGRAEWEAARKALTVIEHPAPTVLRPVADLAHAWGELTPDQRHQYAGRVIESVTVHRRVRGGARWQGNRVKIQPRQSAS